VILDASVVVAGLVDDGPDGRWAESLLTETLLADGRIVAPHLLPAEVSNVLRRAENRGDISSDLATLAMDDLIALGFEFVEFHPFAERIWELRHNLTSYDAWYVSVAEVRDDTLATLDRRLADAPGIRCEVLTPAS